MVRQLECDQFSDEDCDFIIYMEQEISSGNWDDPIYHYLVHYNETHDLDFVARCRDDYFAEYRELVNRINKTMK